jgi:ABC-type transport system involved in multi-copper enzyme maturation permease subunit
MNTLIRAELLKISTLRSFWWTVAATIAFVPLSVLLAMTGPGKNAASLDSVEGFRNVIAASSIGGVLMIIIGIFVIAGEFRFNTITSTFLITPDRRRVISAKLAAASLVGIGVALANAILTLAIALPWLSARNVDIRSHVGDVVVVLLGATASTIISGLVGVGIGSLLTNQTVAITATLIWIFVLETMLTSFASGIGKWLPAAAASSMSGVAPPGDASYLPIWGAALLFTAYGLVFAALGGRLIVRRDIS